MILFEGLKILLVKPFRLFFVLAGFFLFLGFSQLHTAYDAKNYEESIGEICNLTSKKMLQNRRYVTRYSYDVIWYTQGESYRKHYKNQVDKREEGECAIWIRPDNRDILLANPEKLKGAAYRYFLFSLASGVIGLVLWLIHAAGRRESADARMERLADMQIYSVVIFIFCLFGIGIAAIDLYLDYRGGVYRSTTMIDVIIMCAVIAVGCVVAFFVAKKKLEEYGGGR